MGEENEPLLGSNRSRADLGNGVCSIRGYSAMPNDSDADHPSSQSRETLRIRRSISFTDSVIIATGVIIGSGIFISPNMILCKYSSRCINHRFLYHSLSTCKKMRVQNLKLPDYHTEVKSYEKNCHSMTPSDVTDRGRKANR